MSASPAPLFPTVHRGLRPTAAADGGSLPLLRQPGHLRCGVSPGLVRRADAGEGGMSDGLPLTALEAGLRRLHLPTVRRHYPELEQQALQESWSYPEYLERLVQAEIDHRTETRIARSTHKAGFPFLKTLEEFDFSFQ